MTRFRKFAAFASIAALIMTSVPSQAYAWGGGHGYKYGYGHGYKHGYGRGYKGHWGYRRGWRHGYRYGYRHKRNDWVPFAVLGGLATALIVTSAANSNKSRSRNYYNRNYYSAPSPSTRPCHVVHRIEDHRGDRVKMGATMCYDSRGTAYIVQGSEHVVEYLN